MTIDERKFVVTALELLREIDTGTEGDITYPDGKRIEQAIKTLEVALGL